MDRLHRALAPCKPNGLPMDIIAQFHYYRTKEQLLAIARGKDSLTFQGHIYEVFADLSPLTVAKRHALKPHLQVLKWNQIAYHWGIPFSIHFTHLETKYVCCSSEELQLPMMDLGLVYHVPHRNSSRRRSASRSPQKQAVASSSHAASTRQNLYKRGRFDNPAPSNEDSMV